MKTMKNIAKISLFLCLMSFLIVSCKKDDLPEPKYVTNVPLEVDSTDTDSTDTDSTVVVTPPVVTPPVVIPPVVTPLPLPMPGVIPTTMTVRFYLNCGSANETFRYIITDPNWEFSTRLNTTSNIIAVNNESWACNTSTHSPVAYTDNAYTVGKVYHFVLWVGGYATIAGVPQTFNYQSHDFTFQVDPDGTIKNLTTQNLTVVRNQFGTVVNDIEIKCNKFIVNYRLDRQDGQPIESVWRN